MVMLFARRGFSRTAPCFVGAIALILASLPVSAHAQDQSTPQRQRVLDAIEAYRDVGQKIEQSQGPFKDWMGFYSRGGRCEFDEGAAGRLPGMWEKGQFVLWSDDKYLYGMELDASPAVFQFEYRFLKNVIGMDVYELTRVDQLGPAAGVDDTEWKLFGVGVPNPDDIGRLGIRITPKFMAYPDVHQLGWLTYCGPGGTPAALNMNSDPVDFSIRFLQKRLAALPTQ
jgi:hypothetical protein